MNQMQLNTYFLYIRKHIFFVYAAAAIDDTRCNFTPF